MEVYAALSALLVRTKSGLRPDLWSDILYKTEFLYKSEDMFSWTYLFTGQKNLKDELL